MMKFRVALLCGLWLSTMLVAAQENTEQSLQKLLLGKVVLLRTPCDATNLRYDVQGKLLNSSESGAWTVDGVFQVDKVSLQGNKLEIKGKRILIALKLGPKSSLISLQTKRAIKMTVDDLPAGAPMGQISHVLEQIFSGGNLRQYMDDYWRASIDISHSPEQMRKESANGIAGYVGKDRPVYLGGTEYNVKPPKLVSSVEPDYGRYAHQRDGSSSEVRVLVNEQGRPELVGLAKDNVDDLGTQTLLAVSHWKFTPATKDGVLVAVFITVETEVRTQ